MNSCTMHLLGYRTYLVDPRIEDGIKFGLLIHTDTQSSESADYSQLFIEPDADVFKTTNWVPSRRQKLCLICY